MVLTVLDVSLIALSSLLFKYFKSKKMIGRKSNSIVCYYYYVSSKVN